MKKKHSKNRNNINEYSKLNEKSRNKRYIYKKKPKYPFIILSIIIFIIIIIIINLFYRAHKYNLTFQKYSEIFPNKIYQYNFQNITSVKEMFQSSSLSINANPLTKEYIQFIRPISESEEKIYHKKLYENIEPNDYLNIQRNDMINHYDYYKLCQENKLNNAQKFKYSNKPFISIIIYVYNTQKNLLKSIRSIQNQSFKDIEIIIVDDFSTNQDNYIYQVLLEEDPRIRLFKHIYKFGAWKSRLDGLLYSRGKYILFLQPGEIYSDNYIFEDLYILVDKYKLDSVRFSFLSYKDENNTSLSNLGKQIYYPDEYKKIRYGQIETNITLHEYKIISNRITRANILIKGVSSLDIYILNANKNLWDDRWWNIIINRESYSNLMINRIGLFSIDSEMPKLETDVERNQIFHEFTYFWLFDLLLVPTDAKKDEYVDIMYKCKNDTYIYDSIKLNISYINARFDPYEYFLTILIGDSTVSDKNKEFLTKLLEQYKDRFG